MTIRPSPPHTRLSLHRDQPRDPGVRVLSVCGVLDRAAGARLLRLLDAQLALVRTGLRAVRHIVVDLSGVTEFRRAGTAALAHARYACRSLDVGIHLVGAHSSPSRPGYRVTAAIDRYPTVAVALAALGAGGESPRVGGSGS